MWSFCVGVVEKLLSCGFFNLSSNKRAYDDTRQKNASRREQRVKLPFDKLRDKKSHKGKNCSLRASRPKKRLPQKVRRPVRTAKRKSAES